MTTGSARGLVLALVTRCTAGMELGSLILGGGGDSAVESYLVVDGFKRSLGS